MSKVPGSVTEELPLFLTVRDLQRILQVSQSEAYLIAHTIGVSRIRPRVVRVPRETFLRWREDRVAEAETNRAWFRRPFARAY